MKKVSGIYKITNIITKKFYIGSSNHIKQRWNEHKSDLVRKIHSNKKLQNAWDKHGKENFLFEIIEQDIDLSMLLETEQKYLDELKPYDRDIGYNLDSKAGGGDKFSRLSDEEKEIFKQKCAKFGKDNGMFGKNHKYSTLESMKEKSKGRFSLPWFQDKYGISEGLIKYNERNQNLKNRKINYSYPSKNRRPKLLSEDEKKSISNARLIIPTLKPLIIEDINKGTFTTKELTEKYNVSKPTILRYKREISKQ